MVFGTEGSSCLGLDHGLQPLTHQIRDQCTGGADPKQLRQLSGGMIGDAVGLAWGRW